VKRKRGEVANRRKVDGFEPNDLEDNEESDADAGDDNEDGFDEFGRTMKEGTAKLAMTMKKLTNSERNEVTLVAFQV
jgi:hypothetical protein